MAPPAAVGGVGSLLLPPPPCVFSMRGKTTTHFANYPNFAAAGHTWSTSGGFSRGLDSHNPNLQYVSVGVSPKVSRFSGNGIVAADEIPGMELSEASPRRERAEFRSNRTSVIAPNTDIVEERGKSSSQGMEEAARSGNWSENRTVSGADGDEGLGSLPEGQGGKFRSNRASVIAPNSDIGKSPSRDAKEAARTGNRSGNRTMSGADVDEGLVSMPDRQGGMRWNMLLSKEALEDAHLHRASSVTDAHVLRRKGRLKEQDGLIEFIISMHSTHSPFQTMEKLERWVREHLEDPMRSTLSRLIPTLGRFYTPLPLVRAFHEYDEFASLSRRRFVPPNFAEIRHVLNIAQVHAIAEKLALITFDADGTIYADGHHIEGDNKMIGHIIKLMERGVHVAIVTAAGYPGNASKFESRLAGLLEAFQRLRLPTTITSLFHVVGGECNYLLKVNEHYKLEFVPEELWMSPDMLQWSDSDVNALLADAECALRAGAVRLRIPIEIVRKPRAVGAVPCEPTIYEVLEELALTVQVQLIGSRLPFCAFNGGNDVFVDVGNKSVGLRALMRFLKKKPCETLHVGDRFTVSGNDMATRSQCSILWVANPEETAFFTRLLLTDIRLARLHPYLE